jgi:hypothetical protein
MQFCIDSLKHSVSEVYSFILISHEVLQEHLDFNFIRRVLHVLGHSSQLLVSEGRVEGS